MLKLTMLVFLFSVLLALSGCSSSSKKKWVIAVPANNSKYENSARLLSQLMEKEELTLELMPVKSVIEATQSVASGKADLQMMMAHSDYVASEAGDASKNIRTIMPFFHNVIFVFYRNIPPPKSILDVFENSKIYMEINDSTAEQRIGTTLVLSMMNVNHFTFVSDSAEATVMPIWGTFKGALPKKMLGSNWNLYSMEKDFLDFMFIVEPRFEKFTLPPGYSKVSNRGFSSILSTTFLLCGSHVKQSDIHDLANLLFENRVFFITHDKSYRAIKEDFSQHNLNFPMHAGALSYLNRNEPSFLENHAEYYGLLLSLLLVAYGAFQSLRVYMKHRKKERIDRYFEKYISIKNDKTLTPEERQTKYEALQAQALQQLIDEKLDINEFNVFSHIVMAERNRVSAFEDVAMQKSSC